jgi:hypothetical protein
MFSFVGAGMSIQSGFDAIYQDRPGEGLAQEANSSCLQSSGTDALIGECRDKDEWRIATLSSHMGEQFQTAHVWHLHIRNDA